MYQQWLQRTSRASAAAVHDPLEEIVRRQSRRDKIFFLMCIRINELKGCLMPNVT